MLVQGCAINYYIAIYCNIFIANQKLSQYIYCALKLLQYIDIWNFSHIGQNIAIFPSLLYSFLTPTFFNEQNPVIFIIYLKQWVMKWVIQSMRMRNVEAKQACVLHRNFFRGKNEKDKTTNEKIDWREWKSKCVEYGNA